MKLQVSLSFEAQFSCLIKTPVLIPCIPALHKTSYSVLKQLTTPNRCYERKWN